MRKMDGYPEPEVRINMSPGVYTEKDGREALAEAARVVALGSARQRSCIGSGVIPYDAVPETVIKVRDFVERHTPVSK